MVVALKTLLPLLTLFLVPGSAFSQGTISGCVKDTSNGVLPGVEVVASNAGTEAKAVTGMSGCYELRDLAAGLYAVTAKLGGFSAENRPGVTVADGRVTPGIDFVMCVAGGAQRNIDWALAEGGLEGAWKKADLVVHVRIASTAPLISTCPTSDVQHAAVVIEALKGEVPAGAVTFRQEQYAEEPTPYAIGQELILFLVRWGGEFVRLAGPHYACLIKGDRLSSSGSLGLQDLTVSQVLARLRALR